MTTTTGDRRRRPTQERSRQTVERILDAATSVFTDAGYTAATMTAIAGAAGVGIASLYQWFPTKDDILLGLAERHITSASPVLAEVAAELRESMPNLEATIRRFLEVVVAVNADDAGFHRQLFEHCPRTPAIAGMLGQLDTSVTSEVLWHLRRLGLDTGNAALRAELVVQAAEAVVHTVIIARPEGSQRQAAMDETVRLLTGYLGDPPSDSAASDAG